MRVENSLTFMVGSLHFFKSLISQTLHIPGCTDPLAVTEKCLAHRAQRQGCDMVEDNVQKHLKFEADTLKNSQVLLKQTSMQASSDSKGKPARWFFCVFALKRLLHVCILHRSKKNCANCGRPSMLSNWT